MTTLLKINKWALGITLVLYLTVFLGLLAQVLLGVIQVVSAGAVTLAYYGELSKTHKRKLMIYWLSAVFCLVAFWLESVYKPQYSEFLEIIVMIALPMAVAIYFVIILKQFARNHENT